MTRLFVEIDDALLLKVLLDSQERKVSLDTFINEALNAALGASTTLATHKPVKVEDIINSAIERARTKEPGSEFLLVDLCKEEEWEALSSGGRKSLGKGFRKAVESMTPPVATYVRRTSANKAVYQRS